VQTLADVDEGWCRRAFEPHTVHHALMSLPLRFRNHARNNPGCDADYLRVPTGRAEMGRYRWRRSAAPDRAGMGVRKADEGAAQRDIGLARLRRSSRAWKRGFVSLQKGEKPDMPAERGASILDWMDSCGTSWKPRP